MTIFVPCGTLSFNRLPGAHLAAGHDAVNGQRRLHDVRPHNVGERLVRLDFAWKQALQLLRGEVWGLELRLHT